MKKKALFIFVCLFLFALSIGTTQSALSQEPKNILSIEAYDMLNTVPETYLIDVRTRAEYQFVGHPINAHLFPYMFFTNGLEESEGEYGYAFGVKNESFVAEVEKVFKKTDNLLVISRDGKRSAPAAGELIKAGYKNVYNVEDGFEGARFPNFKDENRDKFYKQLAKRNQIRGYNHRRHYGWQWWGLPWGYAIDPEFVYPPDLIPSKQ